MSGRVGALDSGHDLGILPNVHLMSDVTWPAVIAHPLYNGRSFGRQSQSGFVKRA